MNNIKYLFFLVLSSVLLASCSGKITVKHISLIEERDVASGIYYALPQTVVTIDITVSKTDKIRGPYYAFANKYLGLAHVINANSSYYEITGIEIGSYVEPDPAHFYLIRLPKRNLKKQAVMINLSEVGLLKSINDKTDWTEINKIDYAFSDKEAMVSSETFNYLVDANIFEKIDTIIEKIHLDTVTIEKHTLRKSFVEKDIELKAKEVAEYILKIKEKKFEIISGYAEIPYEKASIAYMYEELDKLENEYLLLFTGISTTKTNTYRFVYLPKQEETGQPIHLFNFSDKSGILDPFAHKGDEFFLLTKRKETTQPLKELFANRSNNNNNGIYYRIPEYATISLISKNKTKAESSIIINQFGVVNSLKPAAKLQMQFYPNSGSVKSIGIEK